VRKLVAFLLFAASALQAQQEQALKGKELREFLGPVPPKAFRWTRYVLIDFELYNGEARPPLSGKVGFYLGGHPDFKPPSGSTKVRGRVGRYGVDWYCSVGKDGLIRRDALVRLDDYWRVDLSLSAKRQEDVERLITTIAQLPLFSQRAKPAFGPHHAEHPW
jgi:hypothetical protein